jgi:hypothetical protein
MTKAHDGDELATVLDSKEITQQVGDGLAIQAGVQGDMVH